MKISTSLKNIKESNAFITAMIIGTALVVAAASVGATSIGNAITVSTDLTVNGSTTLGDGSADTITFNAASLTLANTGTTTIPSASVIAWAE